MAEVTVHNRIRRHILDCVSIQDFCDLYQEEDYQGCLCRLEQAQLGHQDREEWSKSWAQQLSDGTPNAIDLNHDRKTALELLYGICNRWKPRSSSNENAEENSTAPTVTEWDIVKHFKEQKVQRILTLTLHMDRANAFYNMIDKTTNRRGLHWYSKEDASQLLEMSLTDDGTYYSADIIVRNGGHTINKRLKWLFEIQDLHLMDDPNLAKWIQPMITPLAIASETNDQDEGTRGRSIETPSDQKKDDCSSTDHKKRPSHAFISYSSRDSDYAHNLKEDMKQRGFEVWMDDKIETGDRWVDKIVSAIQQSSAVVVVMTEDSEKSEWVKKEILLAKRYNKPILPLLLKGQEFPLVIDLNFHDCTKNQSLPKREFYELLRKMVSGETDNKKTAPPSSVSNNNKSNDPDKNSWRVGSGSWMIGASILVVIFALSLKHTSSRRRR